MGRKSNLAIAFEEYQASLAKLLGLIATAGGKAKAAEAEEPAAEEESAEAETSDDESAEDESGDDSGEDESSDDSGEDESSDDSGEDESGDDEPAEEEPAKPAPKAAAKQDKGIVAEIMKVAKTRPKATRALLKSYKAESVNDIPPLKLAAFLKRLKSDA